MESEKNVAYPIPWTPNFDSLPGTWPWLLQRKRKSTQVIELCGLMAPSFLSSFLQSMQMCVLRAHWSGHHLLELAGEQSDERISEIRMTTLSLLPNQNNWSRAFSFAYMQAKIGIFVQCCLSRIARSRCWTFAFCAHCVYKSNLLLVVCPNRRKPCTDTVTCLTLRPLLLVTDL